MWHCTFTSLVMILLAYLRCQHVHSDFVSILSQIKQNNTTTTDNRKRAQIINSSVSILHRMSLLIVNYRTYSVSCQSLSRICHHQPIHLFTLVKALLQVLYDIKQHEGLGWAANTAQGEPKCYICHKTPTQVLYFIVPHEYMVLLPICWFCVGGLIASALN